MKTSKPYFSKETENKITAVILSELEKDKKSCPESALRSYIQCGKNTYENAVLAGVADGFYIATVMDSELAYKIKEPSEEEVKDLLTSALAMYELIKANTASNKAVPVAPTAAKITSVMKQSRAEKLNHAINMIALYGGFKKLSVSAINVDEPVSKSSSKEVKNEKNITSSV